VVLSELCSQEDTYQQQCFPDEELHNTYKKIVESLVNAVSITSEVNQ
jgi:hypothetical protein